MTPPGWLDCRSLWGTRQDARGVRTTASGAARRQRAYTPARATGRRDQIKAEGGGGDDRFEAQSRVLAPGQTARFSANLAAGIYEIECYVAEHDALGMQGTLVVHPDAPLVRQRRGGGGTVEITGFAYAPPEIRVSPGDTVTWRNRDAAPHTVTADNGGFDSGEFARGATYRRRFDRAGTFAYFCAVHPNMRGSVTVRP
jgi:plastocyanin